jgi:hypothetical protein
VLDQRGVTLFDALWAFYEEHEYAVLVRAVTFG